MQPLIEPGLEHVFTLEAELADPLQFGDTYEGRRRVVPILSGKVYGPKLQGKLVQAGAADWQFSRDDDVTQAEATYALQTDDGTLIQVQNFGLRHGPKEVLERMMAGEDVDPAEYYFRANPRFKVAVGKYDWLNRHIFVASGARYQNAIKLWFYQVN